MNGNADVYADDVDVVDVDGDGDEEGMWMCMLTGLWIKK